MGRGAVSRSVGGALAPASRSNIEAILNEQARCRGLRPSYRQVCDVVPIRHRADTLFPRSGISLIRALPSLLSSESTSLSTFLWSLIMNTKNSFRVSAFAASAALFAVGATLSQSASAAAYLKLGDVKFGVESTSSAFRGGVNVATGDVNADGVHYVGRDGNWFNPSNWSTGRVPGADDNVILDGNDRVVIDPQRDANGYMIELEDLIISSLASLEVLPGAVVRSRNQVVRDSGTLIFRASGDVGESLVVERDSAAVTLVQNPNPKTQRAIVLQSSVTLDMGLGGSIPASLMQDAAGGVQLAAGPGHYSTMTVDTLVIDGDLKLSTYYGFEPRPGQSFQIATVNGTRSGEFIGIPEGGYAGCTENNVGLRLSYVGGDGNDLVISAEQAEPGLCLLLPAVQKVREAAARINARVERLPSTVTAAVNQGVAQTREHVLLARQTPVPAASCGAQTDEIAKATCECLQDSGGQGLTACITAKLPEATAQTREHILLARQVGVPLFEQTTSKMPSPTTPISGPKPTSK